MVRQDIDKLTAQQLSVINAILFGCKNALNVGLWGDFEYEEQAVMNTLIVACHRILRDRGEHGPTKEPNGWDR